LPFVVHTTSDDIDEEVDMSDVIVTQFVTAVELNRAVAVAQAGSPAAALEIVDRLALDDYPYLHSTRAELLRRLDRADDARAAYQRALDLVRTDPERRFLQRRLTEL
jgi:RNA polymerase sigma-70 factor (ECF subfamily)